MRLGFKIAKRFLKSNLGQTILIMVGIAIGVSVQIFIGILIQGLQTSLVDKTIGNSPQITVRAATRGEDIENSEEVLAIVRNNSRVSNGGTTAVHATIAEIDSTVYPVQIHAMDEKAQSKIYKIKDKMQAGNFRTSGTEILLGATFQDKYGVKVGDTFTLLGKDGEKIECSVAGFFDLQVATINETWIISDMTLIPLLTGSKNETVSAIEATIDKDAIFDADIIAQEIGKKLEGYDVEVSSWKTANAQLLSGLQGQSVSSIMIQVFVLVSVVLGIASVLAITVLQKSRQIGILKAMGMTNATTRTVFLFQGLMLGVGGAILGILIGLGLLLSFTTFVKNPDGTPLIALQFKTGFILMSGFIAIAASLIASLIPAVRSAKLNPIDIIKNN